MYSSLEGEELEDRRACFESRPWCECLEKAIELLLNVTLHMVEF